VIRTLLLALLIASPALAQDTPAELVRRLAQPATRAAASKTLRALGARALPALKTALKTAILGENLQLAARALLVAEQIALDAGPVAEPPVARPRLGVRRPLKGARLPAGPLKMTANINGKTHEMTRAADGSMTIVINGKQTLKFASMAGMKRLRPDLARVFDIGALLGRRPPARPRVRLGVWMTTPGATDVIR
jgi:hypothetical protein